MPKPEQTVEVKDAPVDPQALAEWTAKYDRHNEGDGTSVSDHFLLMKSYLDQLASLNYTFETLSEVHQMVIEYKKGIKKNKQQTVGASSSIPHVMVIQGGRVQKKPHGKAKGKGKAKVGQYSYPSKTKKPQPQKKKRPAKEGQCHHCKEVGNWKRNCPIYLAELKKKKSGQMVVSTSSGARKPKRGSLYLYMGNGMRAEVEAIGSFDLHLPNGLI
nr:hypothetical protein [Tanacetum cinerariifolium]